MDEDLLAPLRDLLPEGFSLERLGERLGDKPTRNTLTAVGVSTLLFYAAERDANPQINTIFDALEYCASSLSVGYTGIYPQTPLGKLVAAALMVFGPSMAAQVTTGPLEKDPTQQDILATLQEIRDELRRLRPPDDAGAAPDAPA